jgi:hypothetical protein
MAERILVESKNPITQSPQAVEALASFTHKEIIGGVLDLGKVKLVKSSKGDAFYTTTAKDCSCPARAFHPGRPCKHMRRFNAVSHKEILIDAVIGETTDAEIAYWQNKKAGELELMNTVGFRPCLE